MWTYAQIALKLLVIAQWFIERADKRELEEKGYKRAVAETNAATLRVVGVTAEAFGEVAGWTDQQVIDELTKPPSPRSPA